MDKRVNAAIILGAQVNREVKSLSTLDMSTMREAADIEQDANLILGIWDERAAELDMLRAKLAEMDEQIFDRQLLKESGDKKKYTTTMEQLQDKRNALDRKIKAKENEMGVSISQIKILKNRNGKKDVVVNLTCYPDRFLLQDAKDSSEYEISENERTDNEYLDQAIADLKKGNG